MRERRAPKNVWRAGGKERCCRKCKEWKPMDVWNWHVRATGSPIFADCRTCVNPSGRKAGRPVGSVDRTKRERDESGAKARAQTFRAGFDLNPNALLDAAGKYGIDLRAIAARFTED